MAIEETTENSLTEQEKARSDLLKLQMEHFHKKNELHAQETLKEIQLFQQKIDRITSAVKDTEQQYGESIDIMDAFTQKPEDLDFVLPGLLAGTVGSIVSPGGAGKSMLAMQLLVQLAGGPDVLGLGALKRGRVVYFAAEDPKCALLHRLHHFGFYLSPEERKTVSQNLVVRTLLGKHPNLLDPGWINNIRSLASESRLIVLDTFRRFHLKDENSSSDMNDVLNIMDTIGLETGCSIVFIHHANKGSVYSGNGDMQQASRGSGALVDNTRWQAFLSPMSKEEAKEWGVEEKARGYFVRFGIPKVNYAPPSGHNWFRRHEGGLLKPATLEKKPSPFSTNTRTDDE